MAIASRKANSSEVARTITCTAGLSSSASSSAAPATIDYDDDWAAAAENEAKAAAAVSSASAAAAATELADAEVVEVPWLAALANLDEEPSLSEEECWEALKEEKNWS